MPTPVLEEPGGSDRVNARSGNPAYRQPPCIHGPVTQGRPRRAALSARAWGHFRRDVDAGVELKHDLLPVQRRRNNSTGRRVWSRGLKGLKNSNTSDTLVGMAMLKKRELVHNPGLVSHLRPGESIELEDRKEPLVVLRRKKRTLTADEIHAELDRIWEGVPELDAQAALHDLRK